MIKIKHGRPGAESPPPRPRNARDYNWKLVFCIVVSGLALAAVVGALIYLHMRATDKALAEANAEVEDATEKAAAAAEKETPVEGGDKT